MRRPLAALAAIGLAVIGAGLWITRPDGLPDDAMAAFDGDAAAGERIFWAAGCASCHAAKDAEGEDRLILVGGQAFPSEFGTFRAPNVSMHPEHGIGLWSAEEFANAVQRGISPGGAHYYPAFPYTAYALAGPQDVADLWAFWQTLPAAETPSLPHDLGFPFSIRRAVGVWKALYTPQDWAVAVEGADAKRGRYLSEALGHCAECHTPRDALGGLDRTRWLAGAPNPSGKGRIPNITPAALDWSEAEIAQYLADGFTPEFDSAGGHMVSVIKNLVRLPEGDRRAIAAYLKQVPPVE
ncbi:c-type cytochrome [Jannaschia ovalis]|uniref:Cytochrome c n=1 Tax=Jannaschia ovalis TaxID=3038773 RepID=A0ABY8LBN2_9RHOB|nr:cytochrome c [Jannaschia sp. GRR-S6-38]WGH78541.1 cytochrome c [Jannaschia sp. GRR-S6-38]